jgi:hypothetical protein
MNPADQCLTRAHTATRFKTFQVPGFGYSREV